jgi:hypothetical protein
MESMKKIPDGPGRESNIQGNMVSPKTLLRLDLSGTMLRDRVSGSRSLRDLDNRVANGLSPVLAVRGHKVI